MARGVRAHRNLCQTPIGRKIVSADRPRWHATGQRSASVSFRPARPPGPDPGLAVGSHYVIGSAETWFALKLLGHPVDVGAAIAIEALTQAVRHATFIVPGGPGVQEAGCDVASRSGWRERRRCAVAGADQTDAGNIVWRTSPALLAMWVETHQLRRSRAVAPVTPGGVVRHDLISCAGVSSFLGVNVRASPPLSM